MFNLSQLDFLATQYNLSHRLVIEPNQLGGEEKYVLTFLCHFLFICNKTKVTENITYEYVVPRDLLTTYEDLMIIEDLKAQYVKWIQTQTNYPAIFDQVRKKLNRKALLKTVAIGATCLLGVLLVVGLGIFLYGQNNF